MKQLYEIDKDLIIEVEDGCGQILGTLKNACPYCNQTDCYLDCAESCFNDELETEDEVEIRHEYNRVMDGIESLLLPLACEGVDISTEQFKIAIQTVIDGAANNI